MTLTAERPALPNIIVTFEYSSRCLQPSSARHIFPSIASFSSICWTLSNWCDRPTRTRTSQTGWRAFAIWRNRPTRHSCVSGVAWQSFPRPLDLSFPFCIRSVSFCAPPPPVPFGRGEAICCCCCRKSPTGQPVATVRFSFVQLRPVVAALSWPAGGEWRSAVCLQHG